jgi:heterodisulfide reductase subunit A-like polyferredoxin
LWLGVVVLHRQAGKGVTRHTVCVGTQGKARDALSTQTHTVIVSVFACPAVLLCLHTQGAPKMRVAIVGGGLAGLSTAVELLDQG